MADKSKSHDDSRPPVGDNPPPTGSSRQPPPTYSSDGPPAPRHTEHQEPVKGQSQKAQIAQYYKSQGKRPEDVVFTIGGMTLTLADLE
jgi:hypothetical protein